MFRHKKTRHIYAFERQELHLLVDAVGVACEAAARADDAVAGDDDGYGIVRDGAADGVGGFFHATQTNGRYKMLVVYFSSATGNTHRFVTKLGLPSARIPLHRNDPPLVVDEPYVLVCPTYGGGASISGNEPRPVPGQVIRFLNNEHNRSLIRAVVSSGNTNFGTDYGKAGDVIAAKTGVPYVYRFELLGTDEDVRILRAGLLDNAEKLGLNRNPHDDVAGDAGVDTRG